MKKIALCMAMIGLGGLAACGNGSDTPEREGGEQNGAEEITIWAWDPKFNIAAFELA